MLQIVDLLVFLCYNNIEVIKLINEDLHKNDKKPRKITYVKSIRAKDDFFKMCDEVASAELISRNELILKAVTIYCSVYKDKYDKT